MNAHKRVPAPNIARTLVPDGDPNGDAGVIAQYLMPAALADIAKFLEREPEFSYEMTGLDFGIEQEQLDQAMRDFKAVRQTLRDEYASASRLLKALLAEYYPQWEEERRLRAALSLVAAPIDDPDLSVLDGSEWL